jgi:outer membrane protein assembly factor BamB
LSDGDEVRVYRTDPTRADTDEDGLTDGDEVLLYGTDPLDPDSDGDGVLDGIEIAAGSAPRDARSLPTDVVYGLNALRTELLVLNPDTGQAFAIGGIATALGEQIRDIAWSPDGRTLYAQGEVGFGGPSQPRLHTLDPDTGTILSTVAVILEHPPGNLLTALVVDATGSVLAVVGVDEFSFFPSALWRLDPATGVLTRLGPTGFNALLGLAFTPDFRTLYAITGFQLPPVLVSLDPTTGQGTAIAETDLHTQAESMTFTADGRLIVAGSDGHLYELDPATGASTLLGPTGVEVVSGMSLRMWREEQ